MFNLGYLLIKYDNIKYTHIYIHIYMKYIYIYMKDIIMISLFFI